MTTKHDKLSRRDFLKLSALTGGAAAVLGSLPGLTAQVQRVMAASETQSFEAKPENQLYTVCLQCNTGCGIKVKILDGIAAKIDGNPYSPWTLWPHPAYETPVKEMATVEGALCPKGQAGIQTAYDPYRIVSVLKRKPGTKRGEGKWVTIPFGQAIEEVVEGGNLFGEGNVEGLKAVRALTDGELAAEMKAEVDAIWAEKDVEKKKELVKEFQAKFKDHLDALIDPEHPDFGPKNNQFMFVWGRMKGGREDVVHRFMQEAYGSVNMNGHTTVCQGSFYFTGKQMSSNPKGEYDLQNGKKHPIEGKVKVIEGIRPGVVAFPLGFGHWASGAVDVEIDGKILKGDPRRAVPLHANGAMQIDPVLGNVTLSDLAGGSAVFYDSKVKVEKV